MKLLASLALSTAVLWGLSLSAADADQAQPAGVAVVAKSGEESLILWDATPAVTSIVANKTPRDEAIRSLESQTVDIASSKAGGLPNARTITVRIIYEKTGEVSPIYKTATFLGVERVVAVTFEKTALVKNAASFAHDLASGKTPDGVTIVQTGQLPAL